MGECLIVRKGSQPEGTATASDVLSGVTFQSANSDELQTGTLALSGDASASDVLSGKTFYNTNAQSKLTGTMTNNGNVSVTLSAGGSYTIPQGYHGGSGKVTASTLTNTTLTLPTGTTYTTAVYTATSNGAFSGYLSIENKTGSGYIYEAYLRVKHTDSSTTQIYHSAKKDENGKPFYCYNIMLKKGESLIYDGTPTNNSGTPCLGTSSYGYFVHG